MSLSEASKAEIASGVGTKDDFEKPDLSLLPWAALAEVARVLEHGARKYSRDNWRRGMRRTRLIAAAQRHLAADLYGEDVDGDTGRAHLAHAVCETLFALEQHLLGFGTDDRPEESKAMSAHASAVINGKGRPEACAGEIAPSMDDQARRERDADAFAERMGLIKGAARQRPTTGLVRAEGTDKPVFRTGEWWRR